MDVDRMRPIPGGIRQYPMLNAVLLDFEPNGVAIHELAVDGPLAIQPVELEGPYGGRCARRRGQGVERLRGGVRTVIGHRRAAHSELQQEVAPASRQNLGAITAPRDWVRDRVRVTFRQPRTER